MAVDMKVVCPQDVKKMLPTLVRMVCWKKLGSRARMRGVEGRSFGRSQSRQRCEDKKETSTAIGSGNWSWKKDGFRGEVWDTGWSDVQKCRSRNKEEGTEKHTLYHPPSWREVRNQTPERFGEWQR